MRLTPSEVEAIKTCARSFFGEKASVRLFGSRTNDLTAGGDVDLHIEAQSAELATLRNELAFSARLQEMIGEQRIDVVLRPPVYEPRPIDRIALETGVHLL
jgi:uncharacterized protein